MMPENSLASISSRLFDRSFMQARVFKRYSGAIGCFDVINGTLDARKYTDTILEHNFLPSTRGLFLKNASFILQQDFVPPDIAKLSKDWFRTTTVEFFSWPGNSPEPSVSESSWYR
ncbi:transposable element Tcb1 transposase [Trichonephila clavipes]|nr:transposable element Tcb1 transposase [Trichonephila clavipes]